MENDNPQETKGQELPQKSNHDHPEGQTSENNNNMSTTVDNNKNDKPQEATERLHEQRAVLYHAKAQSKQKLEFAFREFEEILRIIHATNWKNHIQVRKNIYEIELICKNAILEIKGV